MRTRRAGYLLEHKIKSPQRLQSLVQALHRKGKTVVFTNGCFDILHYGHAAYLQQARGMGDYLVVALNSDASVRRFKGKTRPVTGLHDRLRLIASLACVDYVTAFNEDTPLALIKRIRPDVLVKGADWKTGEIAGSDVVLGYGGQVCTVKLVPGRSTSSIIEKICTITKSKVKSNTSKLRVKS